MIRCALLACLALAAPVHAQTITSEVLTVYRPDATVAATATLAREQIACRQPKVATPTTLVINPTRVYWDDPADITFDCVFLDTSTGVLATLPTGVTYHASMRFMFSDGGWSGAAEPSNLFTREATAVKKPRRPRR